MYCDYIFACGIFKIEKWLLDRFAIAKMRYILYETEVNCGTREGEIWTRSASLMSLQISLREPSDEILFFVSDIFVEHKLMPVDLNI